MPRKNENARKVHRGPSSAHAIGAYGIKGRAAKRRAIRQGLHRGLRSLRPIPEALTELDEA